MLVLTLSSGEWWKESIEDEYNYYDPLSTVGEADEGGLHLGLVQTTCVVQSNKKVLKVTVTQEENYTGTLTYSLNDSGSIGMLMMMLVRNFGDSSSEWKAVSGKKGPVSITIGG